MEGNISPITVIANTGIVLSKLQSIKGCGFYELFVYSGLREIDFYMACGYLLNENRIVFYNEEGRICIKLKSE
ncbi:MAG: winged helix-turn-helix domain-containing protein [Bacteroidales bacterium]